MKIFGSPASPDVSMPPASQVEAAHSSVARGMALMIVAMLILPIMDGIAKLLSTQYGVTPGQVTFGRFLVQACLLAPIIVLLLGVRGLLPKKLMVNLMRGAIMGTAVLLFFTALRYMPIADAIAVFFIEPFILTILSVLFLKEVVGWRRTLAMIAGFLGALLIVQPSYAVFGPVSLLPMGTALLFAIYLLITRKVAGDDNPLTMQFAAGVGGSITLFAIMMLGNTLGVENLSTPDVPEFGIRWVLIFSLGALAAGGHLMVVQAFRMASASILAPFQYLEIIGATIIGFALFGEFPDAVKWVGIAIIVSSGIYLYFRGRKVGGAAE